MHFPREVVPTACLAQAIKMSPRERAKREKSERVFDAPGAAELVGNLRAGLVEGIRADRVADFVDAEAEPQHDAGDDPIAATDSEVAPVEQARRRPVSVAGFTRRMRDHFH